MLTTRQAPNKPALKKNNFQAQQNTQRNLNSFFKNLIPKDSVKIVVSVTRSRVYPSEQKLNK